MHFPKTVFLIIAISQVLSNTCAAEEINLLKQEYYLQTEDNTLAECAASSHPPHISEHIHKVIEPHLMPSNHPMKASLDEIFASGRVTKDKSTFLDAGFRIIASGPRSFIYVAKHTLLPKHLVKVYFDNILEKKWNRESWRWLVKRCQGAKKIQRIINNYKIKYFTVAKKWMYYLPYDEKLANNENRQEHLAILCVTDMQLASQKQNLRAWKEKITRAHLDELYIIITKANGSSYRPDNIAYTKNGNFAFIDTEYPNCKPDYDSIRAHLNPDMQSYWDALVQNAMIAKIK